MIILKLFDVFVSIEKRNTGLDELDFPLSLLFQWL